MTLSLFVKSDDLNKKIKNCFIKMNFADFEEVTKEQNLILQHTSSVVTDQIGIDCDLPTIIFSSQPNGNQVDSSKPIMAILSFINENYILRANYLTVPFSVLKDTQVATCNYFIQLNDEKYLKIVNKGEKNIKETLQNYLKKGMMYSYVASEDYYHFIYPLLSYKFSIDHFRLNPAEESEKSLELIYETASDLGISESTLHNFKAISRDFENMLKDDFALKEVLSKFQQSKGTYLFSHSHLTAIVGLEMMREFIWADSKEKEKFVMAALLHDLGFNNPANCLFDDIDPQHFLKLSKVVKDDLQSHIIGGMNLLLKSQNISEDVINIIKCHHVQDHFSPIRVSSHQITKGAALFNLTHLFVSKFLKYSLNKSKTFQYIDQEIGNFSGDSFKQITPIFKKKISQLLF